MRITGPKVKLSRRLGLDVFEDDTMTAPVRWTLWIRCCEGCGAGDFTASWGSPAVVPPGDWRCRRCRETAWSLACLRVPTEQPAP